MKLNALRKNNEERDIRRATAGTPWGAFDYYHEFYMEGSRWGDAFAKGSLPKRILPILGFRIILAVQ